MPIYPSSSTSVDDATIQYNSSNELIVKPTTITQQNTLSDITYAVNTTLTSNVYAANITINSGITVITNGYNFFCSGTFTNNGTINASTTSGGAGGGASSGAGGAITTSYGGSGGGGGYDAVSGGAGGATVAAGGAAGTSSSVNGVSGSTPSTPTLTNALINSWYITGFNTYLSGAGGGGSSGTSNDVGGAGSTGIYIQANTIIAGTIDTQGAAGSPNGNGGGGGGGGAILLAYGSGGLTAGTYNNGGGAGGAAVSGDGTGGSGGSGLVMTYSGQPISLTNFSYTSAVNSVINKNSSYQYALLQSNSTSNTTAISQSLTPKTSGLIRIRASVLVSNNTLGNGVSVSIFNGSTLLDTANYTQEGLTSNPHLITLYTEQLFTSPFAQQTYNIQYAAITGGIASCEIQEFTIEEEY